MALGMVIMMTPGNYNMDPWGIGYLLRVLFHISFSFVTVIFIHFTYAFPKDNTFKNKNIISIFYGISFLFAAALNIYFFRALDFRNINGISEFITVYNLFRVFLIISIIYAIISFSISFKHASSDSERKKLKWVLYGFLIGPGSFLLIWILPHIFFGRSFVPESLMILLVSAIPITFTIAIVKYHLLDIDIIINRSIVYATVIILLLLIYTGIISLLTNIIKEEIFDRISSVFAAVLLALIFQPVKVKVQRFVDRKFFRIQYDFRNAIKSFFSELSEINSVQLLAEKIVIRTNELIPVEKIGFFILSDNYLKLIANKNFGVLEGRSVRFESAKLKTDLNLPVAIPNGVEPGLKIEPADIKVFQRWGMVLAFPVKAVPGQLFGFLVLGKRKSGAKFTVEDIDLLNTVSSKASSTFERIALQEEVFKEQLEIQKLEELNKIKSFIVSRISHDFRTPLHNISMFIDLIKSNKNSSGVIENYLKIIEGESKWLLGMADNVLDFSKIEKGILDYMLEESDLNSIVRDAIEKMRYKLTIHKFKIEENLCNNIIPILADKIGVLEAITNLISNSIKYSLEKKVLSISTGTENSTAFVSVKDEGIGISKEDIQNIFEPFVRAKNIDTKKIRGAGLGLAIVKHIMDGHKGSIEIASELNMGSTFKLNFPLVKDEKNINY
jgi:signal transduction histidine kinase